MSAPQLLVDAVQHVLAIKAREGMTTKHDATLMVHGKIEKAGGPTKFGIGAAALRMALLHVIETEVSRQLKLTLTDHEYKFRLPASTPMEVIAAIGKTPRWIAITDGAEALWKFSLQGSPEDWLANAALKYKKAQQTRDKARESEEIAMFLRMNRFTCLAEALGKGV
jgi:hypothetical protein